MIFIETPLFTKLIKDFLPDESYRLLQQTILIRPEVGDLIRGGGGLRKIRWNVPGSGKRGGLRIVYYWGNRSLPPSLPRSGVGLR